MRFAICFTRWAFVLALFTPSGALALDTSCLLDHPIVLSHHWSAKKICADATLADAPAECRASDAELAADLPPRAVNAHDPSLTRPEAVLLHRYYSLEIVERLRDTCGNAVFLADKPPFASYDERARSLRTTVLEALSETGAEQVVIIGMSQGVQDARYLVSELPVDDRDPSQGTMRDKVAAVVSVVGEDGGAESASLLLDAMFAANLGDWSDTRSAQMLGLGDLDGYFWSRADGSTVLSESCADGSCELDGLDDLWRTTLHSVAQLSTKYMRPSPLQTYTFTESWDALRQFVGMVEMRWSDVVSPADESLNGVWYLGYGAAIRNGYPGWDAQTLLTWPLIESLSGDNDGQVSVERQTFANPAANFVYLATLDGQWLSRGYHHMWFSGRDDDLYGPGPGYRERAPYDGGSADFYAQVARDLRGFGL